MVWKEGPGGLEGLEGIDGLEGKCGRWGRMGLKVQKVWKEGVKGFESVDEVLLGGQEGVVQGVEGRCHFQNHMIQINQWDTILLIDID